MISRTDFSHAGSVERPAGLFPKILTALLTPFSAGNRFRRSDIQGLSHRQLRDIGIEMTGREAAAGLLLADLVPRSAIFGPRRQRWQ